MTTAEEALFNRQERGAKITDQMAKLIMDQAAKKLIFENMRGVDPAEAEITQAMIREMAQNVASNILLTVDKWIKIRVKAARIMVVIILICLFILFGLTAALIMGLVSAWGFFAAALFWTLFIGFIGAGLNSMSNEKPLTDLGVDLS